LPYRSSEPVALPRVGRPLRQNQVSSMLSKSYSTLAWEPLDKVGGFLYSTISEWQDLALTLISTARPLLTSSNLPEGWKDEELAELAKGGVCWRDRGYGSLVYQEPPVTSSREQLRMLRESIGSIRDDLIRALRSGAVTHRQAVTIPTNKGKGAPLWAPGTDRDAAFALAVPYVLEMTLDEIDDWLEQYAHRGIGGCLTSYMRGQGGRKPAPYIKPIGAQLYIVGERVMMKVRRVDGFSYSKQLGAAAYHTTLRELMNHALPNTIGSTKNVEAAFSKYKFASATDVSTFDDSISWQLQEAVVTDLHSPVAAEMLKMGLITQYEHDYTIAYEHWVPYAQILAPSPYMYEPVRMVERRGGVPSGSRGTSNNDTLYNEARIRSCHRALGYKAESHIFGDDTLILSDQPLPNKYAEWNSRAGFDLKIAGAPIFLQRIMPHGCALLSRMLVACLNRESRFEASSVLHLAVGIRVRQELLQTHPLRTTFIPILSKMSKVDKSRRLESALDIARSSMSTRELMILLSRSNVPLERLDDVQVWAEEIGVKYPNWKSEPFTAKRS